MKYKHFIFDFDGTICDSYPVFAKAFLEFLKTKKLSDSFDNVYYKLRATNVPTTIRSYEIHEEYKRLSYQYTQIRERMVLDECQPIDGVYDLIKYLYANGCQLYIFSNNDQFINIILEKWGLFECFEEEILGNSGFPNKPAPDAINYLIKKYNMRKESVVIIGDRDVDVMAGSKALIDGILFDSDNIFCEFQTKYKISRIEEIYDIII